MSTLDSIRDQIDQIDQEILALILKRAAICQQVLEEKVRRSDGQMVKVFDPKREEEVIRALQTKAQGALAPDEVAQIFRGLMQACRSLQDRQIKKPMPFLLSIQGMQGSYAERAASLYAKRQGVGHVELDYALSSENVLKRLAKDSNAYGLVALNNAQGGLVTETLLALKAHRYLIIDSVMLKVQHSLLSLPGQDLAKVKNIISHPQALKQCQDFLSEHYPDAQRIVWADTALACSDLQKGKLPSNSLVLAHQDCASLYDLDVVASGVQDLGSCNETLFLLLSGAQRKGDIDGQ